MIMDNLTGTEWVYGLGQD